MPLLWGGFFISAKLGNGGEMKLKDVAAELGLTESQVRKLESLDRWDDDLKGNTPFDNSNVSNKGVPKKDVQQAG
ncbi:phage terminase small subunit-related protein [Paenibacillus alvei]|uniref:phage terminase small subunit-related protein n=1 Tax=Paenibacillus alvei TaxID=44250 RepID=UPI002DDC96D5|nr:phage terminase small subunit-related protein [Paenibacillus alvei]